MLLPGLMPNGIPLVKAIALAALPGMAMKQYVNCLQLKNAMSTLVAHDLKNRIMSSCREHEE